MKSTDSNGSTNNNHSSNGSTHKPILLFLVLVVIIGGAWFIIARKNDSNTKTKNDTASNTTSSSLHTTDEALAAATELYNKYLPLKAQTVAKVGNNQNTEPALVQVIRSSEKYFSSKLYNSILADYTKEYESTGKVTKDDVTCTDITSATVAASLGSNSQDTAVVNVSLTQSSDGAAKIIPVTIDLHTLKADAISCKP